MGSPSLVSKYVMVKYEVTGNSTQASHRLRYPRDFVNHGIFPEKRYSTSYVMDRPLNPRSEASFVGLQSPREWFLNCEAPTGLMDTEGSSEPESGGREPKVQRVLREYGIEDVGERLGARWQGEDGPRRSLRELADDLNESLLEAAMLDVGIRPLDGEVENLHRLLTEDSVGTAQRTEAEAKLERNGIDPDRLRDDFVSHQAVHTYLRDHQGVQLADSATPDQAASAAETIQRTSGRLRSITERAISRLAGEELTIGDPDVFVSVEVYCNDCGRQFGIDDLLSRGGCDCDADGDG